MHAPCLQVTVSGLITYVVSFCLWWVHVRLGELNLSHKTLIDQHFLV